MNPTPACSRCQSSGPRIVGIVAALALAGFASGASAEGNLTDLGLEELLQVNVVSASRFSQPAEEAPASVTVIGSSELRQHGYRNLAEALVTVPGLYSSNDRGYTFLGVRGFNRPSDYGTRILLLTDGARRNDPLYDQALFGNETPVEIDWVKRLEFVPGPASAVYGSNALFGTVNAIMLEGGDINGTRVTLDAGSFGTRHLGLMAGHQLEGNRDWFVGFTAHRSTGPNLYFSEFDNGINDGHANGLNGEKYYKLYAKYRWGNWRLTGNFSLRDKDIATAWYGTSFAEDGTSARDTSHLIELRYDGEAASGWQPSFRLYSGHYRFDGHYRYLPAAPDTTDIAIADWAGGEFHLAYTGIALHTLSFGIDGQWNTRLKQAYFDDSPHYDYLTTNNPSHVISAFIQDEWRFHPDWRLNLGLRTDKHSDFKAETSPRVALIWQPTQRATLKAILGSSYRVPNVYERFYDDGGISQQANRNLQPEFVTTTELAASYRFGAKGRVGLSFYRNTLRDLIDPVVDTSGVSRYENAGRVTAKGIELTAENTWSDDYQLRGSIAWQRSRDQEGSSLADSPRWLGKLVFTAPLGQGWRATGEWLGVSSRQGNNGPVAGYGIANLSVASPSSPSFGQIRLSIYNLGNRRYADPSNANMIQHSIVQDGRQIHLNWALSF